MELVLGLLQLRQALHQLIVLLLKMLYLQFKDGDVAADLVSALHVRHVVVVFALEEWEAVPLELRLEPDSSRLRFHGIRVYRPSLLLALERLATSVSPVEEQTFVGLDRA